MYQKLINDYINKLTVEDILKYAKKKEIKIDENEAKILFHYAKNHSQELLNGNNLVFQKLKKELKEETYKQVYKLYIEAKIKYLS